MGDDEGRMLRQHVITLLRYPQVGPLTAAAIAINLGMTECDLQDVLDSLVADRHIGRLPDGRLSGASRWTPQAAAGTRAAR